MYINIKFLVIAYFISLFVDWVFQWNWQAVNKSNWVKGNRLKAFDAVVSHAWIYTIIVTFLLYIMPFKLIPNDKFYLAFSILFISHALIDTRIPVKWIMRFKGMSQEQINDYQNFGFMHIGIDHRLHELVLLILAMFI